MISRMCVVVAYFFMVLINHSVNGFLKTPKLQVTRKPFKFGYDVGDFLKMDLSFKLPPDVTAGYVVLRYSPTDPQQQRTFEIRRPKDEADDPVATVRAFMSGENVYIDVNLYNKTGVILHKRISEGAAVKSVLEKVNSTDLDSTYSLICLNGKKCEVEADLRKETEDADIKETETRNDYVIIIICLSVFAVAMLLLAIVSFTKSCWFKRDTPEILQIPLQKMNPYYANLLFRKECQEIIDDLEQNQYELIDPFERR